MQRVSKFACRISGKVGSFIRIFRRNLVDSYIVGIIFFSIIGFFTSLAGNSLHSIILILVTAIPAAFCAKTSLNYINEEINAYQVLRSQELVSRIILVSGSIFFSTFSILLVFSSLSEFPYKSEIALSIGVLFLITVSVALVSIIFSAVPFVWGFSTLKDSRLCFKLTLSIIEECVREPNQRYKLAKRNSKFMKRAFEKIREALIEKPYNIEFEGSNVENNSINTALLAGNQSELNQIQREIRLLLDTIGDKREEIKLRETLVSLTRLMSLDFDGELSISELNKTWKASTILQRTKSRLKSPIVPTLATIFFGIVTVIPILLELMKLGFLP